MKKLYLLKDFNNYFNRKVIVLTTLQEYLERVGQDNYFIVNDTNFNPNDGVITSHVVGSGAHPFDKEWQPDYMLVVDWPDGGQPRIVSRWYVTDSTRIMGNQYTVALKRDSIVDKIAPILEAPFYVKKATLPSSSPLIVNSEGMNLNQKKVAEYLLRDRSKVPWIICYVAHNHSGTVPVNTGLPPNIPDIETDTSAEGQLIRKLFIREGTLQTDYANNILMDAGNQVMGLRFYQYVSIFGSSYQMRFVLAQSGTYSVNQDGNTDGKMKDWFYSPSGDYQRTVDKINDLSHSIANDYDDVWEEIIKRQYPALNTSQRLHGDIGRLQKGKIWKYGSTYYEVIEDDYSLENVSALYFSSTENDILYRKAQSVMGNARTGTILKFKDIKIRHVHYRLQIKAGLTAEINIAANRIHPEEVPYDIIAFPYDKIRVNQWGKDADDVVSLAAARSIAINFATACYDVQIVPYCPVLDQFIDENGNIELGNATEGVNYAVVKKDGVNYTIGFYSHTAYQSLTGPNAVTKLYNDINGQEYNVSDICKISDDGRKVDNECDTWRLCAPNWTSQFEFKMTKVIDINTNEPIEHFDVDITFRPYQPYIRVAPQFGFLYDTDYNDARGLICGTGFSITLIDDKWQTYELNNKNYQNMFNREITNMEVSRGIAREQESWNIAQAWTNLGLGIGKSVAGGGIAGHFMESPGKSIAGAVAGGVFGVVAGSMGVAGAYKQADWAERAYKESRDFKLDMFNMSLDNIKALPSSITQSSSISYNFKFYPVLEKYTCTDEERQMVKDKIKWNGMTVGLIGKISDYISETEERYIQGEIIRLDNLGDDSHLANDIYNELNKGLFFEPTSEPNKKEVR